MLAVIAISRYLCTKTAEQSHHRKPRPLSPEYALRPHSALKHQTPRNFVAHWQQTQTALEAEILTLEKVQ
jgi:hypothetical protein